MRRQPSLNTGRCICGLRVKAHYTTDNRRLSCADARLAHRWARIKFAPLRELMIRSLEVGR